MTRASVSIEHEGIVKSADSKSVKVSIISASACAGCHASGICSLSDREEKIVEVPGSYMVSPGETVKVMMSQSSGFRAVVWGYIFPLVLVLAVLIIMVSASVSEPIAGIGSVVILLPYYSLLYLFRKSMSRKFTFSLKTI